MAVTVDISVQETSVLSDRPVVFTVLFSNGGGAPVDVSSTAITVPLGCPANTSSVLTFSGGDPTVSAAGTKYATFSVAFYPRSPPQEGDTDQWSYPVSLECFFDDGSYAASNTVDMQVSPVTNEVPVLPLAGIGELRFDSQNNSALYPVLL